MKLDESTSLEWHSLNFAGKTVPLYNEHALCNSIQMNRKIKWTLYDLDNLIFTLG